MVVKPTVVEDNGKKLNFKAGQHILCNLVSEANILNETEHDYRGHR